MEIQNMSNETSLMKMLDKSTKLSSLKDLVRSKDAENVVLLLDCSASMGAYMRNGKLRIGGLREVVAGIQAQRTTTMVAFGPAAVGAHPLEPMGSPVRFVTEVPDPEGGTPLAEAITFARSNGFGRAIVVSDGGPNDPRAAMEAAREFGGQIDVVFVGDAGDPGSVFLDELAKTTGGSRFEGDLSEVKELTGAIVGLLNGETMEQDDEDDEDEDDEDDEDDDEDDE
jgi:hypothetical protein